MFVPGAPLWEILAAGEWRSPAFMSYLDVHKMEVEMVMQGCLAEESDCDGEDCYDTTTVLQPF